MSLLNRCLNGVLIVPVSHPLPVLAAALALAILSVVYTFGHLQFLTSQRALISRDSRLIRLSEEIDSFDDLDGFVVAVENRDDRMSLAFLLSLVSRLQADKENYLQLFYKVEPDWFRSWALLYLSEGELSDLRENLVQHRDFIRTLAASPGLVQFFEGVNREMTSRMVGELFTGFLDEKSDGPKKPMDLAFLIRVLGEMRVKLEGAQAFSSPWASFFTQTDWKDGPEQGYFWTEKRRFLLLFVTPKKTDQSFTNARKPLTALREAVASVRGEYPDIRAGVTGQEALNEDEMGAAMEDMSLATVISLVCLMGLLVLFWGAVRRPLLEILELLLALSWTFGLATLFIGHLNILSVTFAPMLLGLGIDYGIHWLARYQEEERIRGAEKLRAIQRTTDSLGPGVLLAGLTAALSFFPLVLTGFKGLMELGIITSIGMLMTTVTTLCVLPALVQVLDPFGRRPGAARGREGVRFLRLTNGRALLLLIPATAATGLSMWGAGKVSFDLNMLKLQSREAESVVWEKKLLAGAERSSMYGAVLTDTLEEAEAKQRAIESLPTVSEAQSIGSMLPRGQEEKITLLEKMKPLLSGVGSFRVRPGPVDVEALDRALGKIRFKMVDSTEKDWGEAKPLEAQMKEVRDLVDGIRGRIHGDPPPVSALADFERVLFKDLEDKMGVLRANMDTRPMKPEDLPPLLLERFVSGNHRYLVRVFPSHNIWEPSFLGRFVTDLKSVAPDAVGDPVTLYVFTKAFRDASMKAALYAILLISLLLLVHSRSALTALLVMTPLLVGTLWTFGLMGLLGVDLNLANSIFLPLIVGAGVEYGIVIIQRLRQQGALGRANPALPFSTIKGVILAGLTTTVGFGSLTISHHRGIYSLGLLATIGSLSILAAAVLFLPSALQLASAVLGRQNRICPSRENSPEPSGRREER